MYDFITQFGIDRDNILGVEQITGTTRSQTAYRLSNDAHLVTDNTPVLPKSFSITSIMRMPKETVGMTWDLFKVFDGVAEYKVQINGDSKTVDFVVADATGPDLYITLELHFL